MSDLFPICQCQVPVESTNTLLESILDFKTPSDNGKRSMIPKHTLRIFIFISEKLNKKLTLYYKVSFLLRSSTYFLNCLSVLDKLSTVLQACKTVA